VRRKGCDEIELFTGGGIGHDLLRVRNAYHAPSMMRRDAISEARRSAEKHHAAGSNGRLVTERS